MMTPTKTERDLNNIVLVQAGVASAVYPFRSHPLGLMYVAAGLRAARPGARVRIIDMKVQPHTPESVAAACRDARASVVGIGSFSVHADIAAQTAAAVRAARPDALLIAGGPHASCRPERALRNAPFDAAIAGEADHALPEFLSLIESHNEISSAPGVVKLRNGDVISTPPRVIGDVDALPFPAWDLIGIGDYARVSSFSIMGRRRYMSLFTSRGCPFQCVYCHHIFGKIFRPRGAANVLAEVKEIIGRYGVTDFDILDDVFNLDRGRVHEICEGLLRLDRPVTLTFPNGLRSDMLDDDTLKLLRRAGTRYISFAIESATPRLQKLIHKNLNLERAAHAVRTAAKIGIFCNGFFMLGFPTETEEELNATARFAVSLPLHTAHFLKVTPFDGTDLFDMMTDEQKRDAEQTSDALKYYDRSFNLSTIDNKRFNQQLAAAHRKFYVNPARLLRLAAAHPKRANLLRFLLFALRRIVLGSPRGR